MIDILYVAIIVTVLLAAAFVFMLLSVGRTMKSLKYTKGNA